MIPGLVSKLSESTVASAATITAKTDIVKVTGTTQINTILPALGGAYGQTVLLVTVDGAVVLGTTGNILVGLTTVQNRATELFFVKSLGKWVL